MANDNLDMLVSGMLNEIAQKKKRQPTFIKMPQPAASGGGLDPTSLLQMLLKLFGGGDQSQRGGDVNLDPTKQGMDFNQQQAYKYYFGDPMLPQDPEVGL